MQKLTVGLILLSLVAFGLAIPRNRRRCNFVCDRTYQPKCASDGRTYRNSCVLRRITCRNPGTRFVHNGRCRLPNNCGNIFCINDYLPVCGTDGSTYRNFCHLRRAKCLKPYLRMRHRGSCRRRPFI